MADGIAFDGEVVERQSYLNGTLYLLIEAASDAGWSATLAVTLPKEEGEPVEEGDLALTSGARAWYGLIVAGSHHHRWDESLDAPYTEIDVRLERDPGPDATEPWQHGRLRARIAGDACAVGFEPE